MNVYPTIFIFTVDKMYGSNEILLFFEEGIKAAKNKDEDEIGLGIMAADYVCDQTGGSVKFVEPISIVNIE